MSEENRVARIAAKATWWLIKTPIQAGAAAGRAIGLKLWLLDTLICSTCGNDIQLLHLWQCSRCGFSFYGWYFSACPNCSAEPQYVDCPICAASNGNPLL